MTDEITAGIGHNQPPADESMRAVLADLKTEAQVWLDGSKIENEEQATAVSTLINMAREAAKKAEELRKAEAKPFDDGKAAVQAKWKPITDEFSRIADVAKKLTGAWLIELDRRQRGEAARLAAEAEVAKRAAAIAEVAAEPTSLADREAADAAHEAAKKAETAAKRAANTTAKASTSHGRTVALRTYYVPEIAEFREAAAHYYRTRPDDLAAWLLEQAAKDIRAGVQSIPGITIKEEKRAA